VERAKSKGGEGRATLKSQAKSTVAKSEEQRVKSHGAAVVDYALGSQLFALRSLPFAFPYSERRSKMELTT
jgi:hypothetical protein